MNQRTQRTVWVFTAPLADFPGGFVESRARAEEWISRHKLTGVLTEYPLDIGVYDWAVEQGFFAPKRPEQRSPRYVGAFTSARTVHVHFDNGVVPPIGEDEGDGD